MKIKPTPIVINSPFIASCYPYLIALALSQSQNGSMTVNEILSYMEENFTFEVAPPKSSHEFPAAEFWHNFVAEGQSCGILLRVGLGRRYLTIFND